jgi:archaellum biogenesis protein FlaJ (TadC family)
MQKWWSGVSRVRRVIAFVLLAAVVVVILASAGGRDYLPLVLVLYLLATLSAAGLVTTGVIRVMQTERAIAKHRRNNVGNEH